jgi:hypothetical protein
MNVSRQFLVVVAALSLTAGGPQARPSPAAIQDSLGDYIHAPSGMTFPLTVGDFRRIRITRFNAEETDIGVGYDLILPTHYLVSPTQGVAATVYVYPAPSLVSIGSPPEVVADARSHLCAGEFARRKAELMDAHPGAQLIREGAVLPPGRESGVPGSMAAYEMEGVFSHQKQQMSSVLYVYCYVGGKWAIEYRFSSPKAVDLDGAISTFMAALPWTVKR